MINRHTHCSAIQHLTSICGHQKALWSGHHDYWNLYMLPKVLLIWFLYNFVWCTFALYLEKCIMTLIKTGISSINTIGIERSYFCFSGAIEDKLVQINCLFNTVKKIMYVFNRHMHFANLFPMCLIKLWKVKKTKFNMNMN